MEPKKSSSPRSLFTTFLRFGCFTFGGGWSIVAQLRQIYVEERGLITDDELTDLTSVARSLPGTMIGNAAMMFGHRMAGIPGAFACLLGLVLPPITVMLVIANCYTAFRENYWIQAAVSGVRAAVLPIIILAAVNIAKSAFKTPPCYAVALVCLCLYLFFQVSCVYLVVLGALFGWLISEWNERREGGVKT